MEPGEYGDCMTAASSSTNSAFPSPSTGSVIQDGAVSGVIPEAFVVAVHYPGYPTSASRAVETLGGLPKIAKAFGSAVQNLGGTQDSDKDRRRYLRLKFRPEDPYCHPAFGEPRHSTSLLLRISRTSNVNASAHAGIPRTAAEQLSADVVAKISLAYHFEGMADYQHVLAVHAAESRRKKRPWASDDELFLDDDGNTDMDNGDIMKLVPPLFARKDKPERIVLNPSANLVSESLQKGAIEYSWELAWIIEFKEAWWPIQSLKLRWILSPASLFLSASIISYYVVLKIISGIVTPSRSFLSLLSLSFIKIPEKINWEDKLPKGTSEWEAQMAVSKLFEERPIWPRWSLHERLLDDGHEVTGYLLRRLLFRTGYYFSRGPFGLFWIRKGYDPRENPDSRIYQKVDFRMPPNLRNLVDVNANSELKHKWKDICKFRVWPSKASNCLQLFELDDDYIRQEINKPTTMTTCSPLTGWFSEALLKALRLHVMIRFMEVTPNGAPEAFLKSKIEHFKRCRKREALNKFWKPEKESWHGNQDSSYSQQLPSNSKSSEKEVQEKVRRLEDGEAEAEEEEEEEEEELDGYESPHTVPEDGALPYTASYEMEDAIPNEYLQELLTGFTYSKDGDQTTSPGAGSSDEEYQIYEREDSDDEYDYV